MRKTTTSYTFPGTDVTIPKGIRVWIPNFAIQRDSKYFPEPHVFDPERFTEEAIKSRPTMSFLSFGEGPRNCVGKMSFFARQLIISPLILWNSLFFFFFYRRTFWTNADKSWTCENFL